MAENYEAEAAPRERSAYSAFGDEYKGFDAREDDGNGKGPLIVVLAAGVVLVFGAVVWNAYRQGVRANPDDAPIFAADDDPYKTRMEEDEDGPVSEANMRLFDSIDNNQRSNADADPEVTEISAGSPPDGEPRELRPGAARTPTPTQTTPAPTATPEPRPTPSPTVSEPRPLPPAPGPVPDRPSSVFDASGNYLVQVMALRDRASAETAWAQLREAHADLFAGAVMDIQRADLGAQGIFFRLRVSAFASRENADQFCNALQARNQSCIVITR